MEVIVVSQLGSVDEVYTIRAFIEEVQKECKCCIEDLDTAIEVYKNEIYKNLKDLKVEKFKVTADNSTLLGVAIQMQKENERKLKWLQEKVKELK